MKVVILAGGFGTRLGTISELTPKPLVKIEDKPIIWHIMKYYSHYGFNEFVLALGYKGEVIKNYFCNYEMINSHVVVDLKENKVEYHNNHSIENWKITLLDTGLNTLKGSRIKKVQDYMDSGTNMLSYGDGLSDINIQKLIEFHKSHGKILTISGVQPPSHFGEIYEKDDLIVSFEEKAKNKRGLINGGYMVFENQLFDYIQDGENCEFETDVLYAMVKDKQVMVYKHQGNWACMDSIRDLERLTKMWKENKAFWKIWD